MFAASSIKVQKWLFPTRPLVKASELSKAIFTSAVWPISGRTEIATINSITPKTTFFITVLLFQSAKTLSDTGAAGVWQLPEGLVCACIVGIVSGGAYRTELFVICRCILLIFLLTTNLTHARNNSIGVWSPFWSRTKVLSASQKPFAASAPLANRFPHSAALATAWSEGNRCCFSSARAAPSSARPTDYCS